MNDDEAINNHILSAVIGKMMPCWTTEGYIYSMEDEATLKLVREYRELQRRKRDEERAREAAVQRKTVYIRGHSVLWRERSTL